MPDVAFPFPIRRWRGLAGLAVAGTVVAAATSPAIAQRVPRLFFPSLAVVGGALSLASLAIALVRIGRDVRAGRPLHIAPALVNLVAVGVLAVLPLVRFVRVMTAPRAGPPLVLARFGDWLGGEGYPRLSAHRGVDMAGAVGSDVLAAADGRVTAARDSGDLCGLLVAIVHEHDYRTVYCHFSDIVVRSGDTVRRGQPIGTLGTTGQRAFPGYEHVHLELQKGGDKNKLEDPLPRIVGCFDSQAHYPVDRLVLTYPVACRRA